MSRNASVRAYPPTNDPTPLSSTVWHRGSRTEIVILVAYFGAIITLADIFNVRLASEAMTVLVLVAAVAITRRPVAFLCDWWFFLLGLFFWNPFSSGIAADSPFPLHLDFMLQGDRLLFFGHDPTVALQHALAPASGLNWLDWATAIAYNMHLAEPYIVGYLLWRLNRAYYLQFATAVLALLVLGFVTFILFPAIPPWMASGTYHRIPDVVNRFGLVLKAHPLPFHGTQVLYTTFHLHGDPVAAFPSEHAALPMLELLAFARLRKPWLTGVMVAWVLIVLFSIVYLGEHWVTDALAGFAYAIALTGVIAWYCRRNPARQSGTG